MKRRREMNLPVGDNLRYEDTLRLQGPGSVALLWPSGLRSSPGRRPVPVSRVHGDQRIAAWTTLTADEEDWIADFTHIGCGGRELGGLVPDGTRPAQPRPSEKFPPPLTLGSDALSLVVFGPGAKTRAGDSGCALHNGRCCRPRAGCRASIVALMVRLRDRSSTNRPLGSVSPPPSSRPERPRCLLLACTNPPGATRGIVGNKGASGRGLRDALDR